MAERTGDHGGASRRYQMLDVWRGVVSLVVVVEHAGVALWSAADPAPTWVGAFQRSVVTALQWHIGTPLFFVMSGYCIAASLISTQRRGGTPLGFLARRLWRIYPTYWAAVLLFVAVVTALDAAGLSRFHQNTLSQEIFSPGLLSPSQWLGNLTLTETWRPLVGGSGALVFTRVAWSLCYQEQFYVICVLALWLAPARFGKALAVATAVVVAVRVVAWDAGALHRFDGSFPVHWHEFAIGLGLYWRLGGGNGGAGLTDRAKRAIDGAVLAVLVLGLYHGSVPSVAASAFGLLLIVTHRWDHLAASFRGFDPVKACGRRSFSIYLTHLPVVGVGNLALAELGVEGFAARSFVLIPAVTVASLAFAWGFHHVVECRFLAPPPLLTRTPARPCGGGLCPVPA